MQALEDVKKFIAMIGTKQAQLASWLMQLDGPSSQRVEQYLGNWAHVNLPLDWSLHFFYTALPDRPARFKTVLIELNGHLETSCEEMAEHQNAIEMDGMSEKHWPATNTPESLALKLYTNRIISAQVGEGHCCLQGRGPLPLPRQQFVRARAL